MKFDFDSRVRRTGIGNIKNDWFTPEIVRNKGVVSYSGAEFEFPTAKPVRDAIVAMAQNGLISFTAADDQFYSRQLWWLEKVRGAAVKREWIVPAQGTIFSLASTIRLLTREGEGIVTLTPCYNRYEQAADRLSRRTVHVPMTEDREIDFSGLEKVLSQPENKILVLCNPNNPTGKILRERELRELLALARKTDTTIWCDEIFADVTLDGSQIPCLAELAGEQDEVISVVSLGKTFSLTGMNFANVIIKNPALRQAFTRQRTADHFGSIEPSAYAALCGGYSEEGYEWLCALKEVVKTNHERFHRFFRQYLPQVKVNSPEATYLLWVDFSGLGLDREELWRFLTEEAFFCCDEGSEYFGTPFQARICTAVPTRELDRSLALFLQAAQRRGLTSPEPLSGKPINLAAQQS